MLARKAVRTVEVAEGSAREVGHVHADQEGSSAPHQRSHSRSPRPAVSSQSRQQDPLRLALWPPELVDQGAWMGMNGDGRWRAKHRRTPRSEVDPASPSRMWRPTVFSRELAPLNTATVRPVCDRAFDPYHELSVGVRLRQAAARQANRPTSRRGCRAWLGKPCAGWARPSPAPRSSSGPTVISSQRRLARKPMTAAQDGLSDGRLQGRRRRERKARRGLHQLRNVGAPIRKPLPEVRPHSAYAFWQLFGASVSPSTAENQSPG